MGRGQAGEPSCPRRAGLGFHLAQLTCWPGAGLDSRLTGTEAGGPGRGLVRPDLPDIRHRDRSRLGAGLHRRHSDSASSSCTRMSDGRPDSDVQSPTHRVAVAGESGAQAWTPRRRCPTAPPQVATVHYHCESASGGRLLGTESAVNKAAGSAPSFKGVLFPAPVRLSSSTAV